MFEKWRIAEHMEVIDAAGTHVGTVDSVKDDRIKLTRKDSADGQHHYLDLADIDRIEEGRACLKAGTVLHSHNAQASPIAPAADARAAEATSAEVIGAVSSDRASETTRPGSDSPLFGTSGHGTGMGGSGVA